MNQTYIKNMGSTQTIIKTNNEKPLFNNINWNADYDGDEARIKLNIIDNAGTNTQVQAKLDNQELARLFNIPSVSGNLNQRLLHDFPLRKRPCIKKIPVIRINPLQRARPATVPRLIEEDHELQINLVQNQHPPTQPSLIEVPIQKQAKKQTRRKTRRQSKITRNNLIGKRQAQKYRTPLPKTMRIHFTSPSRSRSPNRSQSRNRTSRHHTSSIQR